MADVFHHSQAKRLFGLIALGGTLGGLSGSWITMTFVETTGVASLLLISAVFIMIAALLVVNFPSVPRVVEDIAPEAEVTVGGSMWAGFTHVARSPYLLGIAGFLLLYTFGSTILYFSQAEIIGAMFESREERTAVLARMELVSQLLIATGQAFLTARVIGKYGVGVALAAVPVVSIMGFAALGASAWGITPLLGTFMVFYVARRTAEFMLTNPARKILFTVVSREDKYKANSFLETFVYRSGDQLAAWGYRLLTITLGLTLSTVAWIAVPLSAVFLALGVWLGRRQRELALARDSIGPRAQLGPREQPAATVAAVSGRD